MDFLNDRSYYRPSALADRWNISIDFLMQLGFTNRLKFKAETDWCYPRTQTIYRGSHVNVDHEELANIYYAPSAFDVECYAGDGQNPAGVLSGDTCIITYFPGADRLLIDAEEVDDYEKHNGICLSGSKPTNLAIPATQSEHVEARRLIEPSNPGIWFAPADAMAREFYEEHRRMPDNKEAWLRLQTHPPKGFKIEITEVENKLLKSKKEVALKMGGETLRRRSFYESWKRWTGN